MTTLIFLALALSMDAFAAAVGQGATARPVATARLALRVGFAFGIAQALMPLLGWALGLAFAAIIRDVDHWVAFVLLGVIGGRMVQEGLSSRETSQSASTPVRGGSLLLIALATSIDAAAAGVTLTVFDQPVLLACTIIGLVTLGMSTAGVLLGNWVGSLAGQRAEVVGGLVLIGIGTKILVEHLFFGG